MDISRTFAKVAFNAHSAKVWINSNEVSLKFLLVELGTKKAHEGPELGRDEPCQLFANSTNECELPVDC